MKNKQNTQRGLTQIASVVYRSGVNLTQAASKPENTNLTKQLASGGDSQVLRTAKSGMTPYLMSGSRLTYKEALNKGSFRAPLRFGFTLIELLVVVLIIVILATVAVPQYQKAVYKSRYATLKNLTESIFQTQEIYYLANDSYADDFTKLDIELPAGYTNTPDDRGPRYDYDWGWCRSWKNQARSECYNHIISMSYEIKKSATLRKSCVVRGSEDPADMPLQSQICQNETGKQNPNSHETSQDGSYMKWYY